VGRGTAISQIALCLGDRAPDRVQIDRFEGLLNGLIWGLRQLWKGHHSPLGSRINATQKCQFCQFSMEEAMGRKRVACQRGRKWCDFTCPIKGVPASQSSQVRRVPPEAGGGWPWSDSPRAPHFRLRFQRNHFGQHGSAKAATSHRTARDGTYISNAHPADPPKA